MSSSPNEEAGLSQLDPIALARVAAILRRILARREASK